MQHITRIVREQITLFPEAVEDYITDDNPIRPVLNIMGAKDLTIHLQKL